MGWSIHREKLHQAAISTAKAISKNKKIVSSTGLSQRPPNINQVKIPLAPQSKNNIYEWRGEADFQAFWHLFHKISNEINLTLPAKMIFNELEISRVEILGCREYKGSQKNINKYINSKSNEFKDEETLSYISYGSNLWLKEIAGFELNDKSKKILKAFLNKYKVDKLRPKFKKELYKNISNQKSFEEVSLSFLKELGLLKQVDEESPEDSFENAPGSSDDINDQDINEEASDEISEKLSTQETNTKVDIEIQEEVTSYDDTAIEEEIDGMIQSHQIFNTSIKRNYSIYTTDFDEIIDAKDLTTLDESKRLRNQLDNLIKPHIPTIGKLANRLQRLLLAKQNTSWSFNLEEGILDNARLHRVITTPNYPLSYKQEATNKLKNTVVTLLIDNSGSMRGRSISLAAICADIIGSTLERCQIKTEILGFTTKHWKGGDSKKLWAINGNKLNPGRLNDIRHIIYKAADNSWRRTKKYLGVMLKEGLLKENIDGEALSWSHERLIKRPEERKILIVISDGAPVDDSTLSSNREDFLDNHLKEIIFEVENNSPVELQAIGIGHDVSKYYKNAITINRAEDLGKVLLDELTKLFNES
tara:strand:+ start:312 stop:2081 length:1770 start_codon:yes stop_codon:yes gene_type:complete